MRLIDPIIITDSEFTSSTIPEPDTGETLWSGATSYAIGDEALVTDATESEDDHWIYIALQANTNKYPPNNQTGDTPIWAKYKRSNRWRMWDDRSKSYSFKTDSIIVALTPGSLFNSLGLFNITGDAVDVLMVDPTAGTVYDESIDMLDLTGINDFYPWFFNPLAFKKTIVLTDLPAYPAATITITIANTGDTAEVGEYVLGTLQELGDSGYPYSGGVDNYNRKTRDDLGFATIEEREFFNYIDYSFLDETNRVFATKEVIGEFTLRPAVFIGYLDDAEVGDSGLARETIIFGYVKSYSYTVDNPNKASHSLQVEELV